MRQLLAIAVLLMLLYAVTALSESILCYSHLWQNPNTAFNTNASNWEECKRHLSWPFSFF